MYGLDAVRMDVSHSITLGFECSSGKTWQEYCRQSIAAYESGRVGDQVTYAALTKGFQHILQCLACS